MSDLTASQWLEVTKAAIYLPQDAKGRVGRYISVGTLRTILRNSRRTNPQNNLLWALYDDILEKGGESMAGWTKQDVHDFFLIEFFGATKIEVFGRVRLKPKRRSSRLTKTQFSEYVEFVVRFMAEHGVVLELPGDAVGSVSGRSAAGAV